MVLTSHKLIKMVLPLWMDNRVGVPQIIKCRMPYDPVVPPPVYAQKKEGRGSKRSLNTQFTA